MKIGAWYLGDGRSEFIAWAPFAAGMELKIVSPPERILAMERDERGYWRTTVDNALPGTRYFYRLDGEKDRPDPASHFQPLGVHGPSQIVNHSFHWEDQDWKGMELCSMINYEIHVGTFTPEGTFDAVIPRLDDLDELGVNTLLIMPLAQCPGERNWGYDGVFPYAVQHSYGGPEGFKRLVSACHKKGFAVKLDVVYNHMGPEGNYLSEYGPYFTDTYKTAWGHAVNVDDAYSDEVRNFFIENALYWLREFHVDVLRLDAADRIYDINAYPFLQELADIVHADAKREGKKYYLIAEADQNDPKLTRAKENGGFGLDAQWCDDFHHCVHTLLTGEMVDYYSDFGKVEQLAKSLAEGFVFTGEYSPYRKHRRGQPSKDISGHRFVVFSQNHDQIGNRAAGERLTSLIPFESLKVAAAVVILSPFVPLIFMGEEYGEDAPFLYFVDHSNEELMEAIRKGRKEAFGAFTSTGEVPDATVPEAFLRSRLHWEKRRNGRNAVLLDYYKMLIRLRKETPALSNCDKSRLLSCALPENKIVLMRRWGDEPRSEVFCLFNFNAADTEFALEDFLPEEGAWEKIIDSSDERWNGPGALLRGELRQAGTLRMRANSAAVYMKGA